MSNTKNAIELHLETLGILHEIQLLEIELEIIKGIISAAIINSRPVEDVYLINQSRLRDEITAKTKRYLKGNELLKLQMIK